MKLNDCRLVAKDQLLSEMSPNALLQDHLCLWPRILVVLMRRLFHFISFISSCTIKQNTAHLLWRFVKSWRHIRQTRPGRRPAVAQPGQPDPPQQPPPQVRRPNPTGDISRSLAELKVISAGPSRYPRGVASSRDKAADRRARALPAEYRRKLGQIDVGYNGTRPGEVGPCVARLETFGELLELVVGAFGEVSSDMDRVISAMAESRVPQR